MIEVFADVACPFTHAGLCRLVARRAERGSRARLRVRAWPLEWVNGAPLDPAVVAREVEALREQVAPELFRGFDPASFPGSSIPALALAAAAYRTGPAVGEAVSLELRDRLFERGEDIGDEAVLDAVGRGHGVDRTLADVAAVRADYDDGRARGVVGSPYFVVGDGWFCPGLDIAHDAGGFRIQASAERFEAFANAALAEA